MINSWQVTTILGVTARESPDAVLNHINNFLWYLNTLAAAWLVYRLVAQGLSSKYRFLLTYFAVDFVQQALGLSAKGFLPPNSERLAYFWIYMIGQAAKLALSIFVVLELCRVALAEHPALAAFARRTAGAVLLSAAVFSITLLRVNPPVVPPGRSERVHYFIALESAMDLTILLFLVAIIGFLSWFPVQMPRNVASYLGGFTVYFAARYMGNLILNMIPRRNIEVSVVLLSVSLACLGGMIYLLRREGEIEQIAAARKLWSPARLEQVTRQLEAINAAILRSNRRFNI